MPHLTYEIVEHDGGWAYRVGDIYSETFATHGEAHAAAAEAAARQRIPGKSEPIQYEDPDGKWHEEEAPGTDRPETSLLDD